MTWRHRTRSRAAPTAVALALATAMFGAACGDAGDESVSDEFALDVFGPYLETEADHFAEVLEAFTDETGIAVHYTGSADFAGDLLSRVPDPTRAPDIAMVPQLGLVEQLVEDGLTIPLADSTLATIDANYPKGTQRIGSIDDTLVGVPFRSNIKSLVWYRPDVWSDNGWTVPTTLQELSALSLQIAEDGEMAPWCLTMESGTATGWVATDWVEDLLVRSSGAEAYQQWVGGELPFSSDEVTAVFDEFRRFVLRTGHLAGGPARAVATPVREVFSGLLSQQPTCAMAKQGDFAASWLPSGTTVGDDGDLAFFVLPTTDSDDEPPLLLGGDLAVPFTNSGSVSQLMEFLARPESAVPWARHGGFLSPNANFPLDEYPDYITRELSERLADTDVVVFDASDQMPVEIGTDLLWSEITRWVSGAVTYDEFALTLDEAFAADP